MCLLPPPIQYITLILNKTLFKQNTDVSFINYWYVSYCRAHYAVYMYVHCTQEMITKYTCKL